MAIRAKGRRPIVVDGRAFRWWVAPDDERAGAPTLTVASADGALFVRYALAQADDARHVVVLGRDFRGRDDVGGAWRRFRCPPFGTGDAIAPGDVAALIRWCGGGGADAEPIEVDWTGAPLR